MIITRADGRDGRDGRGRGGAAPAATLAASGTIDIDEEPDKADAAGEADLEATTFV